MDHGDLETQSKQLDLVTSPTVDTVTPAVPTASSSRAIGPDLISRQSLWRKLRQQPRESAAIVVLIVTAIIWLDSGSSSKKTGSATTLDPTDDCSFWTVQEYADPSVDPGGDWPWATVIAEIRPIP